MPPADKELRADLAALTSAITAIAEGREPADDPIDLFDQALTKANRHTGYDPYTFVITIAAVMAENVRRLRTEAGLRQADLADLMAGLGFAWTRQVAAEVERQMDPDDPKARPPRRLSNEEMVALVALLGVPMIELWQVPPGVNVYLGVPGLNAVRPEQMVELIIGRRGVIGEGGPTWAAAASAIDPEVPIERPARRLWRTRRANVKGGQ